MTSEFTRTGDAARLDGIASPRRFERRIFQPLLVFVLVVLAGAFAAAPAARVLLYLYPLAALVVAGSLLLHRRWCAYLAFAIGMWLLSPEIRRVIDWKTTYHDLSPVTLAPPLVSLLALPLALMARRRVYKDVRAAATVALIVIVYAFLIGIVRNGPSTAAASLLSYLAPVSLGMFVLSVPNDDTRLRQTLQRTALWAGFVVGGYGLIQFLILPPWDLAWLLDSGFSTAGKPEALSVRVFSTLNSPGPLGQVLAAILLLLIAEPGRIRRVLAMACTLPTVGLSLLRSAWAGAAFGVLLLMVSGRIKLTRFVAVVAAVLAIALVSGGPVYQAVSARFSDTTQAGSSDHSLNTRLTFQASIAGQTLANPVGQGLGSTGLATQLSQQRPTDVRTANFDSGLFESLTNLGSIPGGALLLTVTVAAVGVWRRGKNATRFHAVAGAAIASLLVGIFFTNTLRDAFGVVLWCLLGFGGRVAARSAQPTPEATSESSADGGSADGKVLVNA